MRSEAQTFPAVPGGRHGQETKESSCRSRESGRLLLQDETQRRPQRRAVPHRPGRWLAALHQTGRAESVADPRSEGRLKEVYCKRLEQLFHLVLKASSKFSVSLVASVAWKFTNLFFLKRMTYTVRLFLFTNLCCPSWIFYWNWRKAKLAILNILYYVV